MNKEQMKAEAVERMKMLELLPTAIREFENEDKINFSVDGILFWLDEEKQQLVKDFEEQTGGLVYHVIWGKYKVGADVVTMTSLLYVSAHEEEWELEREDVKEGCPIAYVVNDEWNEKDLGSIEVKPAFGGVLRVA